MQWITLFKKEVLESWRNKKWIWVPMVMVLIAIMDPISNHYLPQIIELAGGLPEGAILEFPEISPSQAMLMSLSQINSLGILVIILMSMGAISGERNTGILELTMVKPVKYSSYVLSKWLSYLCIALFSVLLGFLFSWYYVLILFGDISFTLILGAFLSYGLWISFVVTLSLFFSTLLNSTGLAGFTSIATVILMTFASQIFGSRLSMSPNNISSYVSEMIMTGTTSNDLIGAIFATILSTVILLFITIKVFEKKELL